MSSGLFAFTLARFLRQGKTFHKVPTDAGVFRRMASVGSTQTHLNTVGTLGTNRALPLLRSLVGTAVFLLPGIVGVYRTEEINTGTGQTIATALVFHQTVVGCALTEQRDGAAGITLVDVFLQQIERFRRKSGKYVGCMAGQIVSHTTTHGEACGVDAFHIDIGHFLNIFNNRFGKSYVVDRTVAGAASAHVPGITYAASRTGWCYENKAFLVGNTAVSRVDFLTAITAQSMKAYDQRNISVSGIAVRYIYVVTAASATHGNVFLTAGWARANQIPRRA